MNQAGPCADIPELAPPAEPSLSVNLSETPSMTTLSTLAAALILAASGLGPLPDTEEIGWSHAPFELGACSVCHESDDPEAPGAVTMPGNDLCYMCHDQLQENLASHEFTHAAVEFGCTTCHNPHNSTEGKLLNDRVPQLCYACHADIEALAEGSTVDHGAVTQGKACTNCHNPHASSVENILVQLPYDVCMSCHDRSDLTGDDGKALVNIANVLAQNPQWHGPVQAKDCSSCHQPHGGEHFRLLVDAYPAKFYAPYDPENYALCFNCHNDAMLTEPRTTTLTDFRDGERNLHYVHVHKEERGRTCRACHGVHATSQPHQIRDGVPYGPSGWILPINFTETETGGECARTCHTTRRYDNRGGTE
jgi:predicted CXXCH cytochrome family protein